MFASLLLRRQSPQRLASFRKHVTLQEAVTKHCGSARDCGREIPVTSTPVKDRLRRMITTVNYRIAGENRDRRRVLR